MDTSGMIIIKFHRANQFSGEDDILILESREEPEAKLTDAFQGETNV